MNPRTLIALVLLRTAASGHAAEPVWLAREGLFQSLTEPPCSYCSTQNRKGLVAPTDRVVAWIRGTHNGGAVPLRHFLAAPRVINDTYGLFFYDPDGGYVSAFEKDYGYEFHGWRGGVMVVKSKDGTLWSALSGRALQGPQKGRQLRRLPSLVTDWHHWLMLHPESTAYDLFDGRRYPSAELPSALTPEVRQTMNLADRRLDPLAIVHGIALDNHPRAYPLDGLPERACFLDRLGDTPLALFWYSPTGSAVAFDRRLDGRTLTFQADDVSPETAPFKDAETGSRWTLAGRAVDGPLKGRELTWINGIQCRWYAWTTDYPDTGIYGTNPAGQSTGTSPGSSR